MFGNSDNQILPVIFFTGVKDVPKKERDQYHSGVKVRFNKKGYNNGSEMVTWIDEDLAPALNGHGALFLMDDAQFHKTKAVKETLHKHHIVFSMVPPGCTGLVQPLDVSINRPFKDILKEKMDTEFNKPADPTNPVKSKIGIRCIAMTKVVAEAWAEFCAQGKTIVENCFTRLGLTLAIDGSDDHLLSVKGLPGLSFSDLNPHIVEQENLLIIPDGSDNVDLNEEGMESEDDDNEAVHFVEPQDM